MPIDESCWRICMIGCNALADGELGPVGALICSLLCGVCCDSETLVSQEGSGGSTTPHEVPLPPPQPDAWPNPDSVI